MSFDPFNAFDPFGIGASAFNPLSLAPALWLDASTLSGADGTQIASWTDLSGNGRHATQATESSQPKLYNGMQNGKPSLRFDGNDVLRTAAFSSPISQPLTVFLVVRTEAWQSVFFDGIVSSPRTLIGIYPVASKTLDLYAGATDTNAGTLATDVFQIIAAIFNGSQSYGWINGTKGSAVNAGTQGLTGASIGARFSTNFLKGYISECFLVPSAVSDSDVAKMNANLNAKWAVY